MTLPLSPPCEFTGFYTYDTNVQVLWTETIADVNAPTEDEVLAAINLNDDFGLTDIIGWEVQSEIITTPPWGAFATQRVGSQVVRQADLMFAAERVGDDIRMLLRRFDRGFILILPSGYFVDHPNAPFNVYPVRVAQLTQLQRLRRGDGSQILVQFAIRNVVGENVRAVPET